MPDRHLPVRPDLDQLKHQAKDLLRSVRRGDPGAITELTANHPRVMDPERTKLADAQHALARAYGVRSWPRLVLACCLTEAIWSDDADAVRELVLLHPHLLCEMARGTETSNWGPPMTYAANLGRDRIIALLHQLGATDVQWAFGRATLQGKIDTARKLLAMGARLPRGAVMGPAETLNAAGMSFLFELGAELCDEDGDLLAPVALVLETYSRNPAGKHRILELFAERGVELPDTAPMAVHRGRIDLVEASLRRDPGLLTRTFSHREIFPPELGCHADESLALHGAPLNGATLLHICADYDELEVGRWLLERGMHADVRSDLDAERFGGHTALFGCVVACCAQWRNDAFARLLLDHSADPNAIASLRKRLRFVKDESMHEYRDVTPLAWGRRFHDQQFVVAPSMDLIGQRGGGA
jgi:hypothetical protein